MLTPDTVAALIFPYEIIQKVKNPPVVIYRLPHPNGRGVIPVCRPIEDGIALVRQLERIVAV
jgi:hypothetical protein